uniref:Reverse transcriptase domain-containing protein n=1 Tax=Pseudonaja textilis TaxID=8673 RepID=A0A670Z6E5_PSETE
STISEKWLSNLFFKMSSVGSPTTRALQPMTAVRIARDRLSQSRSIPNVQSVPHARPIRCLRAHPIRVAGFQECKCPYRTHFMRKAGLDESKIGIQIAGRNINNLRYADDTTLMKESTNIGLKLNIKKSEIMASGPLNSWQIDGDEREVVTDFIFLGSKITADGDCSQEIKRRLFLGRKAVANLDSLLQSRDLTLPTKVSLVKAVVFPVAMYGCESWTIRKDERQRMEAFELWGWRRRFLRVPWTARPSNRSVLEKIHPDCSLEGQILKVKFRFWPPNEKEGHTGA